MTLLATLQQRFRQTAAAAMAALIVAGLVACAAPMGTPKGSGNSGETAPTSARGAPETTTPAPVVPATPPAPPVPEEVAPATGSAPASPVKIDTSCRTHADCTVKNVGNCCGYYPACVNVNSPTDPKGVQAECARSGRMSVCGFREISGCQCVNGQCEPAAGGLDVQ